MLLHPSTHRYIYIGALTLVAAGLPLSKAFMSIGGIALAVNFLLEGKLRERFRKFLGDPIVVLLSAVFFMHVAGVAWSTDVDRALDELRVKLPLLLFPVVISLTESLKRREFMMIISVFITAVVATSFLSTWEFMNLLENPAADFRSISLFTSHIRYSLMVCISYLLVLNLAWNERKHFALKTLYILLAIWLSIFVFILQSLTGIVIWFLCSYLLLMYTLGYIRNPKFRTIGLTLITVTPIVILSYVGLQVDAFYPDHVPRIASLEQYSAGGEKYHHDSTNLMLENGQYINFYIAYHELEVEWNRRSDIPFWGGKDHSGQDINATLMRYLTSKGLRKDSVGVHSLTSQDVAAIENGVANVRFTYGNPVDNRIYTVIWEIDRLIHEKGVQGHSVTQRIVFWRTGWEIFKENPLLGVGTGDANLAFAEMYERTGSKLSEENRLRAHNQYLSIGILFGITGLLLFFFSIIAPFMLKSNANSFLYIGFSIVLYASMFNEDTLETQVGVTLYAFFNMLILHGGHLIPQRKPLINS